jgi:hypothetical protein
MYLLTLCLLFLCAGATPFDVIESLHKRDLSVDGRVQPRDDLLRLFYARSPVITYETRERSCRHCSAAQVGRLR